MRSALETLRRPAYTGERRCWPCTALNVGVLAVVCGALGSISPALAVGVAFGGLSTIALRGYLVPGTPRFAPRLAAWLPGDPFHVTGDGSETPRTEGSLAGGGPTGESVLEALLEAGVLVDGEMLSLDEGVERRWREEMTTLRALDSRTLAAAALDSVPEAAAVDVVRGTDEQWVVLTDRTSSVDAERWLSRPVAIAEVAAVRTLAGDLSPETSIAAARPLRMFLDRCPVCEGRVERTTSAACCGGPGPNGPDEVLACVACETRLFTF